MQQNVIAYKLAHHPTDIAEISSVEYASRRHLLIAYHRMHSELTTPASCYISFNVVDFYI